MPTFDFKCTECKLVFEELVLKADELVECPNCKSARVVKLLISKTHLVYISKERAGISQK